MKIPVQADGMLVCNLNNLAKTRDYINAFHFDYDDWTNCHIFCLKYRLRCEEEKFVFLVWKQLFTDLMNSSFRYLVIAIETFQSRFCRRQNLSKLPTLNGKLCEQNIYSWNIVL